MNRIRKRISAVFFLVILVISCIKSDCIYASTPISLALNLTGSSMRKGDTMHVSVALQNYNENYTENLITTIIIEVSVDTEDISVNKSSIAADFDEGSGMGFLVAQMKDESNVELQYLNVGDPLKKGTTDLYSFDITALRDIDNLLNSIKITYVVMQDGTKTVSEKLTVVPFVMINGKAFEQESIEEKYTSEYGTIAADTSFSEAISGASSESSGGDTGVSESADSQSSSAGNSQAEGLTIGSNSEGSGIAGGNTSSDNSSADSEGAETKNGSLGNSEAEGMTDNGMKSDEAEKEPSVAGAIRKERQEREWNKILVIIVIILSIAVVLAGIFIYRKKNENISQNHHNYKV